MHGTTLQPTSIINISSLMNLMLPVMVIGMMMKMITGVASAPKRVRTATTTESNPSQTEQVSTAIAG